MAKTLDEKKRKTKTSISSLPPRPKTNAQKVEELKLGKFTERRPLRMPEKEVRQGWRIIGAVALMLAAIIGIYIILITEPVQTWLHPDGFGDPLFRLPIYWLVLEIALVIFVVDCLISSVMLLVKKRVPTLLWQILIVTATIGLLCASFHTFTHFEARKCYENYPGIYPEDPSKGSACPSVRNELILISLRNLLIYTIGIVAGVLVYRATKRHARRPKK